MKIKINNKVKIKTKTKKTIKIKKNLENCGEKSTKILKSNEKCWTK